MASAVAESRPPERSTTAGSAATLLAGNVAPQILMQLYLESHRQLILQYPVGELAGRQLLVARREEHRTALRQRKFREARAAPLIVVPAADHELDQIVGVKMRQFPVTVAAFFPGSRCLDVDHLDHARVDGIEGHRAAGLERDAQTLITQQRE